MKGEEGGVCSLTLQRAYRHDAVVVTVKAAAQPGSSAAEEQKPSILPCNHQAAAAAKANPTKQLFNLKSKH